MVMWFEEEQILKSKIFTCYVIELPFILFSDLVFFIKFKPSVFYIILITVLSLVLILLTACIGLIANLKYPKMNASNDTEVVKQSMSSMISTFIGMGIFVGSILIILFLSDYMKLDLLLILHTSLITLISIILYYIIKKYGVKDYKKINI